MESFYHQGEMEMMTVNFARARMIHKTLGLKRAAGYMRNKGYSPEVAVWVLLAKD
jgi:hypothetical protein